MGVGLSQVTPAVLAVHLTIIESGLYTSILPTDFVAYLKQLEGSTIQTITAFRSNNLQVSQCTPWGFGFVVSHNTFPLSLRHGFKGWS